MEACGSAHHHARRLGSQGHEVVLLPAQYARAYVRRNKTDAADAAALIEAARCPDIRPVPIKSVIQQALQQLHRLRSQWMATRTRRLNFLRGCLREFGIGVPAGAPRAIQAVRDAVAAQHPAVPPLLHSSLLELLAESGRVSVEDAAGRLEILRDRERFGVIGETGDSFRLYLGAGLATNGINCALLGISLADAQLVNSGEGTEDWRSEEMAAGLITVAYGGACLWAGDPDMDQELEALVRER